MAIDITNLSINLDTNRPNLNINQVTGERFLQGNTDKTFIFSLSKNGRSVTIADGLKPTVTLVFYKSNSVYKKYVISPKNADGTNNTNYNIPVTSNNKVTVPFASSIAFSDHAGRTDLILTIEDGNKFYTYSCTYTVDVNEGYNTTGLIDNLPSIDAIKTDVSTLKTDMATAKTNIQSNTNAIATKANTSLSNVGTFSTAPDGSILYKKDDQLKYTPLVVDDTNKIIKSPYSLKIPPNTLDLGANIALKENGGFIEFVSNASGKHYLLLDYENDNALGSQRPIWYERGELKQKVEIQSNDTQIMNNVTSLNLGQATQDYQVQAFYFNLASPANNLKIKLVINGNDVAYYPSEASWNGQENGYNLVSGLQRIAIQPFWTTLSLYTNRRIDIKADSAINLKGNGTLPYYALDLNYITKHNVAMDTDVPNINLLATKTLGNVSTTDFEKKFMATDAYNRIAQYMNTSHPDVISQATELKPSTNINLSTTAGSVIYVDYQFNANNQVIRQQLPPANLNKYIMFATVYPNPYSNTQVILTPASNENINGSTNEIIINRSGFLGIAVPKSGGYEWVQSVNLGNTIEVSSQQGDTVYKANKLLFPFANGLVNDNGIVTVNTSFIVSDENSEIVSDCSIVEVPSTSLISVVQNQGNSNAAVIDFKGLPIDMGDATPVINAEYLSFPQATVTSAGNGKVVINTAPSVSVDGTVVLGRAEDLEFPSSGGLKAEAVSGTDTVKITSKGFKATRNDMLEVDGVKTLAFNDDDLIIGTEDITDPTQLNVEFLGLPTSKTNTSIVRKATKLEFPQANVFGTDGGTVHVGTGHSINKLGDTGKEEITAVGNAWTFGTGLNAEIDPNDPNGVVITTTDTQKGISITKDDTEPVNETTVAYFPQTRVEDGPTSGSKTIKTSIPLESGTDNFDDYTKININNDDFNVTRDNTDTNKLNINFGGISVESDNVETPHIKVFDYDKENFSLDVSTENLAKISIKNSNNNGFMAVYSHKQVIAEAGLQEIYRTTALMPNTLIWQDDNIQYDKTSGMVTLKYNGSNGEKQLFKIVARATVRRQLRQADLGVYLYLWNPATNDYIQDINGETPIVNNTIKKELVSDDIEIATMISITQDTSFKIILKDDTPNKYIEILDLAMGTSAICIEKVNAKNQPSNALANYERLTQQSMRFIKHEFTSSFENAQSLIATTPNTNQSVPDDTNLQKDGWLIYFQEEGTYKQNTTPDGNAICFEMVDKLAGFGYFNITRVLEYEDTWALRGHEVKAKLDRVEQTGDFKIVPVVWKRRINEYPSKIITNMNNNGEYSITDGWEVIEGSKTDIVAPTPAETAGSFTCTYTVPNDAVNVGFMLMASKQQTRSIIKFTDFSIGCDPTFERWIIEYPAQAIESQLRHDSKYVKYVQYNTTPYDMSQWYQIPNGTSGDNNYSPLYTGEAQLGGNADITRIYNSASSDFQELHNKGKWRFGKDGRVTVHYKIPVATDKFASGSDHNAFRIGFVKDTGGGDILQGTPITASLREINIPKAGNVFNDSVRTNGYANATFTMDVKENDEYWIALNPINIPREAGNEGHMYSYPSGMIEFTFLENEYAINKLENDLAEMKKLLRATSDAISNKAYIELGYDTNNSKPTLEAKLDTTP